MPHRILLILTVVPTFGSACGQDFTDDSLAGDIPFEFSRPTLGEVGDVPVYTGNNDDFLKAQAKYRTGLDFHRKVIVRTCAVTGGVCHNQKEYPDMHTPANFLDTIGAPCNVVPRDHTAVFDRCERPGDRFLLEGSASPESVIGHVEYIRGDWVDLQAEGRGPTPEDPGIHIYLRDPIGIDGEFSFGEASFIRKFENNGTVEDRTYGTFRTRWWPIDGGLHLYGEVRQFQVDDAEALLFEGDGQEEPNRIVQGDHNRNGVFGAFQAEPLSEIIPADPFNSYIVGRLRGQMPTIDGSGEEPVPGTRMPLANQPLAIEEMLAMMCWILGLPQGNIPVTLESGINYVSCSQQIDPSADGINLLGDGSTTWLGFVLPILLGTCGGNQCHGGSNPAAGLDLQTNESGNEMYDRLVGVPSTQQPGLNLVEAGDPASSYLFLKLTGDPSITGGIMPAGVSGGLSPQSIDSIQTWITNGALRDE